MQTDETIRIPLRGPLGADTPRVTTPRRVGTMAPRGQLVATMRDAARRGDDATEREACLSLARLCLERGVHLAETAELLARALSLWPNAEDREPRSELARHLARLGRHEEAAEVLRGAVVDDDHAALEVGLAAADLTARGGDASGAAVIYRELALSPLADPRPLERLAMIAAWSPSTVSEERASEAWLEAATRTRDEDARHLAHLRAFEIAPGHHRAAATLADDYASRGRHECADDVLRQHGRASGEAQTMARERLMRARHVGLQAVAFGAALDLASFADSREEATAILSQELADSKASNEQGPPASAKVRRLTEAIASEVAGERAESLLAASDDLRTDQKAACLVIAAEAYVESGQRDRAVSLARRARSLAPQNALAAALLLELGNEEGVSPGDLEAALGVAPPRAAHYRAVARRAARRGRPPLALAWLRRALAIRPADGDLRLRLATVSVAAANSHSLDDLGTQLRDLVDVACPSQELTSTLARVIDAVASRDAPLATGLGLEILERTGPTDELVEATMRAALAGGDPRRALEAVSLDAAVHGSSAPEKWLCAFDLALPIDIEVAAAHLGHAAATETDPNLVARGLAALEASLDRLTGGARSDAELDVATARAWLAERGLDANLASTRWRELGAARWDLAGDAAGGEDAFFYAYSRSPADEGARYVQDLVERAGTEGALSCLLSRLDVLVEDEERVLRGALQCRGAELALELGRTNDGAELSIAALENPTCITEALRILDDLIECLALNGRSDDATALVTRAYTRAAVHAAGTQGERAAWFRGGRALERLGAHTEALAFAVRGAALRGRSAASEAMVARLGDRLRQDVGADGLKRSLEEAFLQLPKQSRSAERPSWHARLRRDLEARIGLTCAPAAGQAGRYSTTSPPAARDSSAPRRATPDSEAREPSRSASGIAVRTPAELLDRPPVHFIANVTETPLERELASHGDHAALVAILRKRAHVATGEERLLLRLRRAWQLARGLRDLEGACGELEEVLEEMDAPDPEVLSQLARWLEERGALGLAAVRWEQLLDLLPADDQAALVAVRASEAYLEAKDFARARRVLDRVTATEPTPDLVLMRLATANAESEADLPDFPRVATSAEAQDRSARRDEVWRDYGVAPSPEDVRAAALEGDRAEPNRPTPYVDADEIAMLEEELDDGEWSAGEHLAAIYLKQPTHFGDALISVRRRQAALVPGAIRSLQALADACRAAAPPWVAAAVEHVVATFQGTVSPAAPPLAALVSEPDSAAALLFGHLEGTVCDAMALACRGGLLRESERSTSLVEFREVRPHDGSAMGELRDELARLVHLSGVRVFQRDAGGPDTHRVILRSPLCLAITGIPEPIGAALAYSMGSKLAAATPPCAYVEALDEGELDLLFRALLAAFGPVPDEPLHTADPMFSQLTQDLWSIVTGADERRVRDLCYDPVRVAPGLARHLVARARRRTGLFACGDLGTALRETARELELWSEFPHGDPDGLRDLCSHPAIANLVSLALDPTYARLRWRTTSDATPAAGMR